MNGLYEQIQEAAGAIRGRISEQPRIGIVLGTGLGGFVRELESPAVIPYAELPHFPKPTAPSHAGRLVIGRCNGVPVAVMEGRFHYYEGYSLREVTFPVRVLKAIGVETVILTNAAGGMNPHLDLADVVAIEDHINFMPDNPLRGLNDDRLGLRFPDMSMPYDRGLIETARTTARELKLALPKGVFVAVPGPNLETRAEYRMLRLMGADVVGMSTVPEVIVARHAAMRVLAFSVVTDICLPDALEEVDIAKIIAQAEIGGERLGQLLRAILPKI